MTGGIAKQAKILSEEQVALALGYIAAHSRHVLRDRVRVLMSVKAGLRAKEIAGVTWGMVCDAEGAIGDAVALTNATSKGRTGGRIIPLHRELRAALAELHEARLAMTAPDARIVYSERGAGHSARATVVWFHRLYKALKFTGASSHSGRRTFLTKAARAISQAGGSIRDVQQLAGHSHIDTTMRYIEGCAEAKVKLMELM